MKKTKLWSLRRTRVVRHTTRALLGPFRELGLALFWKSRWPAVCEKMGPKYLSGVRNANLGKSGCYIFEMEEI